MRESDLEVSSSLPLCAHLTDQQHQIKRWAFGRTWTTVIFAAFAVAAVALCLVVFTPLMVHTTSESSAFPSSRLSLAMAGMSVRRIGEVNPSEVPTNSQPYRTGFHFQPIKNWMNDPNGMLYYEGYYHLFYQYNPYAAVWGNITWGHAVSKDLVHWLYLDDEAIKGTDWYDIWGAWSGSVTFLKDGTPVILYTGWSNNSTQFQIQTQNLAYPVNKSDPLLRQWYKAPENPVMVASQDMNASNYRDPTTGWLGKDGLWRVLIGSRDDSSGTALLYKSKDFVTWTFSHEFHKVAGTGMWECPDFFPVALSGKLGVDTEPGPVQAIPVKHVLKVSLDLKKHDYYTVGTYNVETDTFTADDPRTDAGIGLRYDYGKFYASKTFFDRKKGRRILCGWANESDSVQLDISKGWSSVQFGRKLLAWSFLFVLLVTLCQLGVDLIQLPVEEVDGLHRDKVQKLSFLLKAGSTLPVEGVRGSEDRRRWYHILRELQYCKRSSIGHEKLDVEVLFDLPDMTKPEKFDGLDTSADNAQILCSSQGTATQGHYGPFGVLVLASEDLREHTSVFFMLIYSKQEGWKTLFCSDPRSSTLMSDVDKTVYGTYVRVSTKDKTLTLRILVDHSIVESFAQNGRTVITSRVYPTLAVHDSAFVYLFNNGTQDMTVRRITAFRMADINLRQFGTTVPN